MKTTRVLGVLVLICGIALMVVSRYIDTRVAEGQGQIESAQKKVDFSNRLFSLSPSTEEVGKGITGSVQEKIDTGRQEVRYYSSLARTLWIVGIILLILAVVGLFISFTMKKKSKS